ncbi:hypothetical protein [Ottowia testudinis]|uniref:Uncharacterized protein n=1 Tax=Ottowia testudinis TaxID=2816950 RepID=A0A975H4L7_9BURK|nr:hypothetical protein [Ottowia testudinis]QTD46456.1 hypothetical protein J1M35_06110 [Ottowia testudinis]
MLKEVGASGQISLGKRFAGQLFEMVGHADERVELIPMKLVASGRAKVSEPAWLPPGGYTVANAWAMENHQALEDYAAHIAQQGTAAEQMQQYLEEGESGA